MRKVNYKEKGITLIALVVTIIILLILAGVTLTTALSQNGLFQRAKIAGEKYKESEEDETEKLREVEKEIDKIINGETPPDLPNPPTPPSGGIGSSDIAGNLKEYQGKYVDIGVDINGNESTADDWELFYATDDRIFLIAADCVPVTKLGEWKVIGENATNTNGFQQDSSNTYDVYWPSGPTAFLTLPTIDNFLKTVMHEEFDLYLVKKKYSGMAVSQLLNTNVWDEIKNEADKVHPDCVDFAIGGPTLEMWCAAWNEAVGTDDATFKQIQPDGSGENGYCVGCTATGKTEQNSLYMDGNTSGLESNLTTLGNDYKTFFPHVGSAKLGGSLGYWLASPSSGHLVMSLMSVRYDGRVTYADYNVIGFGVRPVVSLRSGVQIVERAEPKNIYDLATE